MKRLAVSILPLLFLLGVSQPYTAYCQATPTLTVTSVAPNPVMTNGAAGAWDSIDVMNPAVFAYNGQLVDYYSGWDGNQWGTGIATSNDGGNTWSKVPSNPLLLPSPTISWATQYIFANGSTLIYNGQVMTFAVGQNPQLNSQIGLATADPAHQLTRTWTSTPVLPIGATTDADAVDAADPDVIIEDGHLQMYYLGVSTNYVFSIMQALSFDGHTWLKNPTPVLTTDTTNPVEAAGVGEPTVWKYQGTWFMIYGASAVGQYRSLEWAYSYDGRNWTKAGLIMSQSLRPAFASAVMGDPNVVPTSTPGQFLVFYGGGNIQQGSQNLNGRIGLLTITVTP